MTKYYRTAIVCAYLSILFICGLAGCDRLGNSRYSQLVQDADTKSANGDFARAINLYEAALDDSPRCAEIHYKLALLYDEKRTTRPAPRTILGAIPRSGQTALLQKM